MAAKLDVLLVTAAPEIRSAVTRALESNGRFRPGTVSRDLDELTSQLKVTPKEVVLVDIDHEPAKTLTQLDSVSRTFNQTCFIVLCSRMESGLLLEAMQAGARHYIVKDSIGNELSGVLKRLLPEALFSPQGRALTLLSAGGGCGSTTLAINLANELAILEKETALLVDLDSSYGALTSYLGLQGQFGIANVLTRNSEIDPQVIRTTARVYSQNLHVLISPAAVDLADAVQLRYERLAETVRACKYAYRHVVFDAPRVPIEAALELVINSDLTLMVFQLTVKDISVVRRLLATLKKRSINTDGVMLLANRYRRRQSMIAIKEAEEALGGAHIRSISNDYRSAISCLNLGRVLAEYAPRSTLRRELSGLAQAIMAAQPIRTHLKPITEQGL